MGGSDDDTTPAGWYRQKDDPSLLRWWDGDEWTDETMPVPDGLERRSPSANPPALGSRPAPSSPPLELSGVPGRPGSPAPTSAPATPTGTTTAPTIRIGDDADDWVAGAWAADEAASARRRPAPAPQSPRPRQPLSAAQRPRSPAPERPRSADGGAHVVRSSENHARQVLLRALIVFVLLGVGWFGYTQVRDAGPGHATTLPSAVPTVEKPDPGRKPLTQVVLSLGDLPRGWSTQNPDPSAAVVCSGRAPASVLTPTDVQVRTFSDGTTSTFLTNVAEQFASEARAKQFMDLTAKTADTCRSYEVSGSKIRLGPLDFPSFGDQTFAVRATGTSPFGAVDGALVYVRKGSRVTSIQTIALGGKPLSQNLIAFLTRGVSARL